MESASNKSGPSNLIWFEAAPPTAMDRLRQRAITAYPADAEITQFREGSIFDHLWDMRRAGVKVKPAAITSVFGRKYFGFAHGASVHGASVSVPCPGGFLFGYEEQLSRILDLVEDSKPQAAAAVFLED